MLWSHAYGRSMCYLRVLWSRGCKIPYLYLTGSVRFTCGYPRGPCGFHTGMGTSVAGTVRSRVDALRAWQYPYDQRYRALRDPVRPASACSCYIYHAIHDYMTFDLLGPGRLLTGYLWAEIAGSSCLKVVHAQPSVTGYTAQFRILRKIVRTRNACRVISHVFTQAWPLHGLQTVRELHVT